MKEYVKLLEGKRLKSDTRGGIQLGSPGAFALIARQHRFVGPQQRGGNVAVSGRCYRPPLWSDPWTEDRSAPQGSPRGGRALRMLAEWL